ncbi:MAG: cupin domain-containing protein [Gaiellaceae bacterium]
MKLAEATIHETPNAIMRVYAGPTATGSVLAVWRAEMRPDASGPLHTASTEQVLVVIEGRLKAVVAGKEHLLEPGDSLTLPAGVERQLSTAGEHGVVTLTSAEPGATARVGNSAPKPIPWAC